MLARKGYSADVALQAVREALQDAGSDDPGRVDAGDVES
jgi:hypothetical protein